MIIRKQGKIKELNSPPTKIIQPRENQELVVCLLREKKNRKIKSHCVPSDLQIVLDRTNSMRQHSQQHFIVDKVISLRLPAY